MSKGLARRRCESSSYTAILEQPFPPVTVWVVEAWYRRFQVGVVSLRCLRRSVLEDGSPVILGLGVEVSSEIRS